MAKALPPIMKPRPMINTVSIMNNIKYDYLIIWWEAYAKDSPHPQDEEALGLLILNPPPIILSS